MSTSDLHEDTHMALIEGISNDILFAVILLCFVIFAFYLWINRTINRNIHRDHVEQVQDVRERILANMNENEATRNNRATHREERCPICIDHYHFAVETNCGHVFCCPCIMSYYEHGNWIAAMNCPVCRQQVNVLLPEFSHEDNVHDDLAQHLDKIRAYNRRYSGEPRPILDYIMDFPVLARHMFRNLFSVSGLVVMLRLRIILYLFIVLVYILSPLDIIPESVLGLLGFLDDIAIAAVILLYLTVIFRQSLANN